MRLSGLDWWGLFHNSLWVVGLAIGLAAVSMASYRAHMEGVRLWQSVAMPGFQLPFSVGFALLCLGLLLGASVWWERVLALFWGGLACGLLVRVVRATSHQPGRDRPRLSPVACQRQPALRRRHPFKAAALCSQRAASRAAASLEIWLVGLLVFASLFSTRVLPWAVVVAGGFWLVRWAAYGRITFRTPADLGILALLLLIPVTLWITPLPGTTRVLVYRLLCGIALYYAIVNWSTTFTRLRLLVLGIVLVGVLLAAYALVNVQWVSGKLAVIPSRFYDSLPLLGSDPVNPNVMAGSLVILLPFAPSSLLFAWRQLPWHYRALGVFATVLMIGALVATQSRSALLALLVVLVFMLLLLGAAGLGATHIGAAGKGAVRTRRRAWLVVLALALAGAVATVWLVAFYGNMSLFLDALLSNSTLGGYPTRGLGERLEIWSRALYMVQDFPFTGIGMGSFEHVTDLLYPLFIAPGGGITHAHNLFLQVAVDLGLPGLIAWLSVLMLVMTVSWRAYRRTRDGWLAGLGAGLLCSQGALAVHGIANVSVWGEIRSAPIVWAIWGLAMAAHAASLLILHQASDGSAAPISDHSPPDAEPSGADTPRESRPEPAPPQAPGPHRGWTGSASRRARWMAWGSILVGSLLILGWVLFAALQLFDHAQSLQDHLRNLESLAQGDSSTWAELESVGEHLAEMRQDLEGIQSLAGPLPPVGRLLGWVPKYGGDLAAAPELLDLAVGVAVSGDRMFQALSPALDQPTGPDTTSDSSMIERLLPVLAAAEPELQGIRQELVAVEESRTRLHAADLSPRVAGLVERLDRYLPWLQTAVDGALLAPSLLGVEGPRAYLILAQNNHELRATGGFISGVGELWVEGGDITSLSFRDSYAVDNLQVPHEVAPRDFQQVLGGELWFFRDTNWSTDFPTSAQRALEVYARDQGVQADGVITVDLVALQLLVGALGPLQVEGMGQPVTGESVVEMIQAAWGGPPAQDPGEWWLQRKDFMGEIARAALDRAMTESGGTVGGQLVTLARALKKALDEKHILVYLAAPQAAELLRRRNWDGALAVPSEPLDMLMIVDSNVGFNKADPNVERSVRYEVDLARVERPRARLTLTYRNHSTRVEVASSTETSLDPSISLGTGIPAGSCIQESRYGETYADLMEGCYWGYLRVYVPEGSRLLSGPELPLPPGSLLARHDDSLLRAEGSRLHFQPISPTASPRTMDGWEVWTAFFDLLPLEETVISFDYQLPRSVLLTDRHSPGGLSYYHLRVQKQPGTEAVPLQVAITLPPGAELVDDAPSSDTAFSGLPALGPITLATNLRLDREFVIVFRQRD